MFLRSCSPALQEDFMAQSDCFVYTNEVKSESISHGHVEYIDTTRASGCAKEQLKNVYLLYYDTICIAVLNQHPRKNFKLIQSLIRNYQTDTTRLAEFVRLDSSIRITVNRKCKEQTNVYHYNKYVEWRHIEYSTLTKPFIKTKDSLVTIWCNWAK
jgi:hypothetical protein